LATSTEIKKAVDWALKQEVIEDGVKMKVYDNGRINNHLFVDFVRKYYNVNNIEYGTFDFNDLKPYL